MEPIFDSHAHYDDEQFDPDRDALLNRIHKQGVSAIVNASSTMESCDTCVRLAQQYPFVYAAVGIHPNEAATLPEDWLDRLRALARRDRVVAIGEIGLDYYYKDPPAEVQKRVLRAQLALAKELDLPVIIHSRDAIMDTYEELKGRGLEGVIHCFSGSAEMAKLFLDEGFYLGFGGVVTFKNAKRVKAALAVTPLDRLLFETDCPYLAPEPFRGKRNDSSLIRYTAAAAEEILHTDRNVLLRTAADNAARLFRIR